MANSVGAPFAGINPKFRGLTVSNVDLTGGVPALSTQAFVAVGDDLGDRQVEVIEKLRKCLDRLRQTSLATGGTNNYIAKMDINSSSGQVVLALDSATTLAETEVAVGYGPQYFPANRVGLSGYLVPTLNYLIDFYHESILKNKTEPTT